jgi:putative Mn2+ efflux pump MntP
VSYGALLVLAVGLAMDATAVAAARGACVEHITARDTAFMALLFGGMHVVMPLAGAIAGLEARDVIERWDHWIAFGLLVVIGARMAWSAWRSVPDPEHLGAMALVAVAFATSIDALTVGITLPLLDMPILIAAPVIGGVTGVACIAGLFAGRRFGARIGARAGVLGGLALIAIGTKILVEHLAAGH